MLLVSVVGNRRATAPTTPVDVEATKAVLVREGLIRRVRMLVEGLVGNSGDGTDVTDRYNVSGTWLHACCMRS